MLFLANPQWRFALPSRGGFPSVQYWGVPKCLWPPTLRYVTRIYTLEDFVERYPPYTMYALPIDLLPPPPGGVFVWAKDVCVGKVLLSVGRVARAALRAVAVVRAWGYFVALLCALAADRFVCQVWNHVYVPFWIKDYFRVVRGPKGP